MEKEYYLYVVYMVVEYRVVPLHHVLKTTKKTFFTADRPSITPEKLEEIREEIMVVEQNKEVIIILWQWFD